jgi:hypothetical protein
LKLGFALFKQLQESRLASIAQPALMPLDDPRIAAWSFLETWPKDVEQLFHGIRVGQFLKRQPASMQRALLGQRDEFFHERPRFLGLFNRGDNAFVLDERLGQVTHQGQAMRSIPTQLTAGL